MPHEALTSKGYQLVQSLGKGAYGQVWKATDSKGVSVAVKIFHDESCRAKAKQEASALAMFDNLHLLRLHAVVEDAFGHELYLVTEFASGGDLLKMMQERDCQPLPEDDARRYFRQLVFALDHMHKRGWVHRDVKCENVLLSEKRDHIILADFGFATQWSTSKYLNEPLGSLHYSAPEIVASEPYRGPEVDIWSLGVVLYALCTGRLPFGGSTEQEIADRIVSGSCPTPRVVTGPLRSLISSLLTVDACKRATLDQVKLHPWVIGSNPSQVVRMSTVPVVNKPSPPVPALRRPAERRGSVIAVPVPAAAAGVPTRPRRNSIVEETVKTIAQNHARTEAESHIESTTDETSTVEGAAMLAVAPNDEGFLARLSRFTKSGVKRFSLSRLTKKN